MASGVVNHETWAVYCPKESRYLWHTPNFHHQQDPWTLFQLPSEQEFRGTLPDGRTLYLTLHDGLYYLRSRHDPLLDKIFEYAPGLIVTADDQGRMQMVNHAVCSLSGYSPHELRGKCFYELIPEDERDRVQSIVTRCFDGREVTYSENHWVTSKGEKRLLQWSNTRLLDDNNDIIHIGIARDITEQRRAEEQLEVSEARYRNLVENAPDLILEISQTGQILFASPNARNLLGILCPPLQGTPILSWIHEDDWQRFSEQLQQPQAQVECRLRHSEEGWRWFSCLGKRYTAQGEQKSTLVCRDITSERAQLQSQKMQAVGLVAAGLAQEFLELLEQDDQEARHKAKQLARQLQHLSKVDFERERVTLESLLEQGIQLLSASLQKTRIQLSINTQDSWLSGGRAQLEQLLLHMGLSARDNVLHIETHSVPNPALHGLEPNQAWVELRVAPYERTALPALTDLQAVALPGEPYRIFLPLS